MGRLSWAEEEFALLESTRWEPKETDPRITYQKLKGARKLGPRALALLRELYAWRESTASKMDRASFRVLGNEVLFQLANHPVRSVAELGQLRGVGRAAEGRWGGEILAAIEAGLAVDEADLPRFTRGPRRQHDPEREARLEKLKAKRNKLAEEYALQPGVLCPNGILEGIATLNPDGVDQLTEVPGMRNWQREELGERLIED